MTDVSVTPTAYRSRNAGTQRGAVVAAGLSIAMAIVLIVRNTDDGPAWRVGLVLAAVIAVATGIVFGFAVRRALAKPDPRSSARASLILGALAVLSFVVFWLAVTPIFGIAALVLARDARDRAPFRGETMATVGAVLGGLGIVAGLAMSLVG